MEITRTFGLFYIFSSTVVFVVHLVSPDSLGYFRFSLSVLLPLLSWATLLVLAFSIPSIAWKKFLPFENWIVPQMILFMIVSITNHAIVYSLNGITSGDTDQAGNLIVIRDIWECLYFSMVTWTTLGYGDLQPIANTRFIAASEALMGYFSVGLILGAFFESANNKKSKK